MASRRLAHELATRAPRTRAGPASQHAHDATSPRSRRGSVAAARAMHDDGWWWHQPSLDHAGIKRQVLFEMLAARLLGPAQG